MLYMSLNSSCLHSLDFERPVVSGAVINQALRFAAGLNTEVYAAASEVPERVEFALGEDFHRVGFVVPIDCQRRQVAGVIS